MSRRKRRTEFDESACLNNATYGQYYFRLMELAMSMFEWSGLPDTVDARFLELTLFNDGQAVFFMDEAMGALCLQVMLNGRLNVYRIPIERQAFASNGYRRNLNIDNSVIIYNNMLRSNSAIDVELYAKRLYNLDRIIDVNANAQKTPVLLSCDENERLSVLNAYKEFDGNAPVIKASKNLDLKSFQVLKTDAPYVADKLYDLKTKIWNEALTYLGISNMQVNKKERLLSDEVERSVGGTIASRYSRLEARRQAAEEINRMFGLDVKVNYRQDVNDSQTSDNEVQPDEENLM